MSLLRGDRVVLRFTWDARRNIVSYKENGQKTTFLRMRLPLVQRLKEENVVLLSLDSLEKDLFVVQIFVYVYLSFRLFLSQFNL